VYCSGEDYTNPCHLLTAQIFELIYKAYEKFLFMAAKYPPQKKKYIHPSYAIDVVWHSHMICPKVYEKETLEWVGYLVDHDPWPNSSKKDLHKGISATDDLWKKEFRVSVNDEHVQEFISAQYARRMNF